MRHLALEIIFHANSLLIAFESPVIRDNCYKLLLKISGNSSNRRIISNCNLSLQRNMLNNCQLQWMEGRMSNFDYLMFLNRQSGRSFNDLTQYPIMPWVITDYTSTHLNLNDIKIYRDLSKPVGSLNPVRLKKILDRYYQTSDVCAPNERFMYGSHYSTPGYVMYFLVRQYPEYMLHFQNGKFDKPDRLFSSIERTFDSAFHSISDVKELIPQFYDYNENESESFLCNSRNLNLGIRSDTCAVHDVQLPPWVEDQSPKTFIRMMRSALESEYVSAHLHSWIDLIWGYKQRGKPAESANNVFYYLTYEGAVNIEEITDPIKLHAITTQIHEFGQIPSQLFKYEHPHKAVLQHNNKQWMNTTFKSNVHKKQKSKRNKKSSHFCNILNNENNDQTFIISDLKTNTNHITMNNNNNSNYNIDC